MSHREAAETVMVSPSGKSRARHQAHIASPKRVTRRRESAPAHRKDQRRTLRSQSKTKIWGVPLWQVARGPNPTKGERVGHARAIVAVGDIADGLIAVGGIARGLISIGGVSLGVCSLGGISVGLVGALGGVALAPVALGGVAVGFLASGGVGRDVHGRFPAKAPPILRKLLAYVPRTILKLTRMSPRHGAHVAPSR